VDRDPAPEKAAHRVPAVEDVEREGEERLDLARVRPQVELGRVRDAADERVDAVAGDERRGGGEGAAQLDVAASERDLLLGLAQGGPDQVGVGRVPPPARERDLAGMAAEVGSALGEDQPGALGPAIEGEEDGGVGVAANLDRSRLLGRQKQVGEVAQMITWTVPPSTDQAAPLT
jgi:hypothetical protein